MSKTIWRVFLSSTIHDLVECRALVAETLERMELLPVRMETFGARAGLPVVECKNLAHRADLVVCVVGKRLGWVPSEQEGGDGIRSITWLEVEAARANGCPVLVYIHEDPSSQEASESGLRRFVAYLRA